MDVNNLQHGVLVGMDNEGNQVFISIKSSPAVFPIYARILQQRIEKGYDDWFTESIDNLKFQQKAAELAKKVEEAEKADAGA